MRCPSRPASPSNTSASVTMPSSPTVDTPWLRARTRPPLARRATAPTVGPISIAWSSPDSTSSSCTTPGLMSTHSRRRVVPFHTGHSPRLARASSSSSASIVLVITGLLGSSAIRHGVVRSPPTGRVRRRARGARSGAPTCVTARTTVARTITLDLVTTTSDRDTPDGFADAFGANSWLVDEMYERYRDDPTSVSGAWQEFFADYRGTDGALGSLDEAMPLTRPVAAFAEATPAPPASVTPTDVPVSSVTPPTARPAAAVIAESRA